MKLVDHKVECGLLVRLAEAVCAGEAIAKPEPLPLLTSPRRAVDPRTCMFDLPVLSTPATSAADALLSHCPIPVSLEPAIPEWK
jgi:hypothetical protein